MGEERNDSVQTGRTWYRVRPMQEKDLTQVMVIEEENFSIPWSRKSFLDMMNRPEAVFLVAAELPQGQESPDRASQNDRGLMADKTEEFCLKEKLTEQRILGYAGAVMALDEGDVTNIAVLGTYKKQGIATGLLNRLISETAAAGVRDLFLEVREHNIPALGLYRAAGFVQVGRRKGYYDKPKEDALIMKKAVPVQTDELL